MPAFAGHTTGQGDCHNPAPPLMWLMDTVHYLQEFRGHGAQTSTRWTWFPLKAHTNTGRLCSAGSGRHPVPRRPRSYAALRLPRLPRSRLRFPLSTTYLDAEACSEPAAPASAYAQRVGDGSPVLRTTGFVRGEARTSQVTGPSSSGVPWCNTPPDTSRSSPKLPQGGSLRSNCRRLHAFQNARHPEC